MTSSAPAAASGAGAVQAAESARQRRAARNETDLKAAEDEILADLGGRSDTRAQGGRVFIQRDGVWTDAAKSSQRVIRVRAFSTAYFEMIRALPELEGVLREGGHGDEVLVAGARVSVQMGAAGSESMTPTELRELVAGFRGR